MLGHNRPPVDDILEDCNDQRSGWIAISREIRDHWLVGYGKAVTPADPTRGSYSQHEAFQDLLMECRYRKGYVVNGGRKMQISPGQVIGAISWLAARWNWTPKKVRWFLDQLVEDNMITRHLVDKSGNFVEPQRGNRYGNQSTIITVCNYTKYQSVGGWQRQSTRQSDGNQGAIEGQSRGNQAVVTHCFESEKTPLTKEQGNKGTKEPREQPPLSDTPRESVVVDGSDEIVRFVMRYANVDELGARKMLRTNCQIYGTDNIFDAYALTTAEMAAHGKVASPFKYMIRTAGNIRDEKAANAENNKRRSERGDRQALEKKEMMEIAQGAARAS